MKKSGKKVTPKGNVNVIKYSLEKKGFKKS